MKHIKSYYDNYSDLIERIGEDKIISRYEFLFREMMAFISDLDSDHKYLCVNESLLMHSVLEYYKDIEKLKKAHDLQHANDPKVVAYTAYWLLKRKPIQFNLFIDEDELSENLIFVNEKYVLSIIIHALLIEQETRPIVDDALDIYRGFISTLYYYLKFRKLDAQSIEMIIMAFEAGKVFG